MMTMKLRRSRGGQGTRTASICGEIKFRVHLLALLLSLLIRDGPTVVRVVDDADDGNLCQDAEKDRL